MVVQAFFVFGRKTMSDKIKKFARGAAIAATAAVLAYVSATVIPALEVDGTSAVVVALLSMAVNGIKLLITPAAK